MVGHRCPTCQQDSVWLSTTNEWCYYCEQHGRFNEAGEFQAVVMQIGGPPMPFVLPAPDDPNVTRFEAREYPDE